MNLKNSSFFIPAESHSGLGMAIQAAAYLKKHSHTLEDSILRRNIVGTTHDEPHHAVTYCSSCDAAAVSKCLKLLSSLSPSRLLIVVRETAKILADNEAAKVYPPAKTGFKPMLDCKRRPVATNFSFMKMKKVVKKDLLLKGLKTNAEMTLREAAFFNPKPRKQEPVKKITRTRDSEDPNVCRVRCTASENKLGDTTTFDIRENSNTPVPQVKLDHNHQIIVDPSSLIAPSKPVTSYTKGSVSKTVKWSLKDTVEFYKALHRYGTDFSLMASVFPSRDRKNIKRKFVAEDKKNRELVDMAIGNSSRSTDVNDIIRKLELQSNFKKILHRKS